MNGSIDEKLLIAYADGELAGEQRRAVEQHLSSHPESRRIVEAHQRLTRAARRTVRGDTPPVPLELRAAVNRMMHSSPVAPAQKTERSVAPVRSWVPLAAAASILLMIGAGVWLSLFSGRSDLSVPYARPSLGSPGFDGTLSATLVAEVTRVHLKCSRILDHFLSPEFGRSLAELPGPTEEYLGTSGARVPDLTALNYDFNGAGPCTIPGGRTLHLLYRSRSDPTQHVSLFLQPDEGQLKVDADILHIAAGADADHPTLVWRSGGLVYYIVADSFAPADATAAMVTELR